MTSSWRYRPPSVAALVVKSEPWMDAAACVGLDVNLFFPERGESFLAALRVCGSCRVKAECLEYALTIGVKHGIYGARRNGSAVDCAGRGRHREPYRIRVRYMRGRRTRVHSPHRPRRTRPVVLDGSCREQPACGLRARVAALREAGWTVDEISAEMGWSHSTIYQWLRSGTGGG